MVKLSLCFKINHPLKLNQYRVFDIGKHQDYFKEVDYINEIQELSKSVYSRNNEILLSLIEKYEDKFNFSLYVSGLTLQYISKYCPLVLKQLKELSEKKNVEFIVGTFSYCLSFLFSDEIFKDQVGKDLEELKRVFPGAKFSTFKNTFLLYDQRVARGVDGFGLRNVLIDNLSGVKYSSNYVYSSFDEKLRVFVKNEKVEREFEKFLDLGCCDDVVDLIKSQVGDVVSLSCNYKCLSNFELFLSGLFESDVELITPSQYDGEVREFDDRLSFKFDASDSDKIAVFNENILQQSSIDELLKLRSLVLRTTDEKVISAWHKLLSCFHLKCMNTSDMRNSCDENVGCSPYDSYVYFVNVISDMTNRVLKSKEVKYISCDLS